MLLHYLVKVTTPKSNITAGDYQRKLHQMYHQWTRVITCLNLLIWDVIHQCMFETIHDVNVLQKHLMQTWFDFDQDTIGATIDQ